MHLWAGSPAYPTGGLFGLSSRFLPGKSEPLGGFRSLSQIRKAVSKFQPDLLAAVALRPILLLPLMRACPTAATVNLLNGLGSLASGAHLPPWLRPASWWLRSLLGFAISRANCWTVTQNEADLVLFHYYYFYQQQYCHDSHGHCRSW
jgi:hypothetical protein